MATQQAKPIVVVAAYPMDGHTGGPLQVAEYLVRHGFTVYFIGATRYEDKVGGIGARFVGADRLREGFTMPDQTSPTPMVYMVPVLQQVFIDYIPVAFEAVKRCLEAVRAEYPEQQVVVLQEVMFLGMLPFVLGAPLPRGYARLPQVVTLSTTFQMTLSRDIGPSLMATVPAKNDEDRLRISALNESLAADSEVLNHYAERIMSPLGATRRLEGWFLAMVAETFDVTLVPHAPRMDFPRSDLNPKIRFIGGFPLKGVDPSTTSYPSFWDMIKANADGPARKHVVFVAQGSVSPDYSKVILPTIEAMSGRQDVLVVAVLGRKGAQLPLDVQLPANAFVVDYLPYDALLPLSDVFVFNAGFNGFMHAVMNAVPMVVAGTFGDKAEVSLRADLCCRVAVNIETQSPSPQQLEQAIDAVLADHGYKERALALRAENEQMDSLGAVEKTIWEVAEVGSRES